MQAEKWVHFSSSRSRQPIATAPATLKTQLTSDDPADVYSDAGRRATVFRRAGHLSARGGAVDLGVVARPFVWTVPPGAST